MENDEPAPSTRLAQAMKPVLGNFAWDARSGHGSFITMNFGPARVDIAPGVRNVAMKQLGIANARVRDVVVHGSHHLWLYQCAWDLVAQGAVVRSRDANAGILEEAAQLLNGQRLIAARIEQNGSCLFRFDMDTVLSTAPETAEDEQWMLFDRTSGRVATLRGDGFVSFSKSDSREESMWAVLDRELDLSFEGSMDPK